MTRYDKLFDGMPRDKLEQLAADALDNLTAVQGRCTAQQLELRTLRASLILPGWSCAACGVFTGTAKEALTECRSCGAARLEEATP